jgi:wobble nucleotide-excising tRNase
MYFIACAGRCDTRRAELQPLDDLLKNYDSEYQYLFKLVWEASQATDSTGLEQLFHYPNVARRLLEAFLAFRMPDVSQVGLRSRLMQTPLDAAKRERVLRFLDFQSHEGGVDVPEEDLSSLAETPEVLRDVLGLMKEEDKRHFDRMCHLVAPPQEPK